MLTILAWVKAQAGSLQDSSILANIPDVEVYENWDGGKCSHSKPSQHEDVCQHDELKVGNGTDEHGLLKWNHIYLMQ